MPAPQLSKIALQSGRRKAQRKRPHHFQGFAFVWLTSDKHLPKLFLQSRWLVVEIQTAVGRNFASEKRSPQVLSEMTMKCNTALGALAPSPPISMLIMSTPLSLRACGFSRTPHLARTNIAYSESSSWSSRLLPFCNIELGGSGGRRRTYTQR